MGETKKDALRVYFDNKLKLEFYGVKITTDADLLAYRKDNRNRYSSIGNRKCYKISNSLYSY